jgi:hypothetical protein
MVHELVAALEEVRGIAPDPLEAGRLNEMPAEALENARGASLAEAEALARENEELKSRIETLAALAARREGDAQSTGWRVAELEQQVAALEGRLNENDEHDGKVGGELAQKLEGALEELDILKQALAQEHEARMRAESGAELVAARAELQKQAALIEQLSRAD